MIPYMVGKLAPMSSNLTRGLVKYVPGRGCFRAIPSQDGDKYVTSPPPPPIVELVVTSTVPFQDLSQRVNAWRASHLYSWMYSTLCGEAVSTVPLQISARPRVKIRMEYPYVEVLS